MFDNKYPYTDFHELNLDWILSKITEFEQRIDGISEDVVKKANEYTDLSVAQLKNDFAEFTQKVDEKIAGLDTKYDDFVRTVNNRMNIADARISLISDKVDATLSEAAEYTNQAITNNNEYIIAETTKALAFVTVVNYFTGERISVQEMFDYLAQFHLENAISYSQLVDRAKTYNELIAYNMTYTDLAKNGGTIII